MKAYETINWYEKDIDEVFDYLHKQLEEKERYHFFSWLIEHFPDLEFDWLESFTDIKESLSQNEKIDAVLSFVTWYRQKDPNDYLERYAFLEMDLCNYFLYKNDREKLKERIAIIQQNPVSAIDILTIRLVFQLIYHGHYDLAVSYSEAVWKSIDESDKLIGFPAFTFVNTIYVSQLQKFHEANLNGIYFDENELFNQMVSMGFNDNKTIYDKVIRALKEDLSREKIVDRIQNGKTDYLLILNIHFLKYMFDSYQIPFVFSDWIWHFIINPKLFGKQKGIENWFFVDTVTMDKHIRENLDSIYGFNDLEIFGKVWGLEFVFDFLQKQQLLSALHYEEMIENIAYFRTLMIKIVSNDLWQMMFVFNWPKVNNSEVDPSFQNLFKGTYGISPSDALRKIEMHLSNYQTPERITKELKSKDSRDKYSSPMWGTHNPIVREEPKVGRNDLCPCGSGKKFKKCCMDK